MTRPSLRNSIFPFLSFLLAIVIGYSITSMIGCQTPPAVTADQGVVTSLQNQVVALQKQIAATTQPADLAALNAQLATLKTELTAAEAKESTDASAAKAAQLLTAQQITATGATIAAAVPTPWTDVIAGVLGVASAVLGVIAAKQTSKLGTAQQVIAAAAPGVAKLVSQVTDNQTLATDITSLAGVSSGVLAMLNHPTAVTATGGVSTAVANAIATPATIPTPIVPAQPAIATVAVPPAPVATSVTPVVPPTPPSA
jgi:hypothetical protein